MGKRYETVQPGIQPREYVAAPSVGPSQPGGIANSNTGIAEELRKANAKLDAIRGYVEFQERIIDAAARMTPEAVKAPPTLPPDRDPFYGQRLRWQTLREWRRVVCTVLEILNKEEQ